MITTLIVLYVLTLLAIAVFLYIKVRSLPEIGTDIEHVRVHHERWLYHLVHELWRRGMRAFRGVISRIIVTFIKWWIHTVVSINRKLRKRFPHLGYLFGERVLVKHPDEVEASEFIREIRAHQEELRENPIVLTNTIEPTPTKPIPPVRTQRIRKPKRENPVPESPLPVDSNIE